MSDRPVAFITGAGRGIGRGIAIEMAGGGFDIVGCDLAYHADDMETGLGEVKTRVEALGAAFEPAPGDISRLELHEGLLEVALKRFQRIDVLVNNAGVAPDKRLDILETTPESFDRVLSVNTRGTFFLTQRFARHMAAQKRQEGKFYPAIIFITSVSAYMSSLNRAEYCISKAATSHAARMFAHRLAEFGIAAYDIQPGIIETDMTATVKEKYDALVREGLVPQRRLGQPDDVARAVLALARGDFRYSTGLVVDVSGGMHIQRL